jgi:glutamate racemase
MVPTILIFDSGLGGLSVHEQVIKAAPHARYIYVADNAGFPYGGLGEDHLIHRVTTLMATLIALYRPDIVIIACSTASTLVLPHLRNVHEVPFIGTVPAIKPAAEQSKSRMISVLATRGTAKRPYTQELVRSHASDCDVKLVGSEHLAAIAEAYLQGKPVDLEEIYREIAPCFQDKDGKRTDIITLSCTHYPFLLDHMKHCAPWQVLWIDPAPAIAKRLVTLLSEIVLLKSTEEGRPQEAEQTQSSFIAFTGSEPSSHLAESLKKRKLSQIVLLNRPLEPFP